MIHRGDPIAPAELGRILRVLGNRAGVPHCDPHRFRHTAARLFIRNGGDAFALQRLLGHEGLETTRRYVEHEREDVERAHQRASPVDRWGLK
jgi:integrase/recombinase XerD